MVCYHPLKGWADKTNPKGIVFVKSRGFEDLPRTVPCGGCVGCRLEHSRQWAIRCFHEASLHEYNCFVTLTYNDEYLPNPPSLDVRVLQLFMKRLRNKYGADIKFFACGEYGENLGRPHYHLCLFNHDFQDRKLWQQQKNKEPLYRSAQLEALWTDPETGDSLGFSSLGNVTFQSAAYVARYIMKKITGKAADRHYSYYCQETGVRFQRTPEFTTMSRRPGIGTNWLKKYATDVYPDDFIIINGKRMRPPRFYDQSMEVLDEKSFRKIKHQRQKGLSKHLDNNTPERLAVREEIQHLKNERLVRNHDKEPEK